MKPHITYCGALAGWRCIGPRAIFYADSPSEALRGYLAFVNGDPIDAVAE